MGVVLEFLSKRKEKEKDENKKGKFSLETWVPDAAKKAKQLSLATHVCKYSHPDAKATPIISTPAFQNDGYLRSGNVNYENAELNMDAYGNAAAMGVFNFLSVKMTDGRTILEHLADDSVAIKEELSLFKDSYQELRHDFLAIKKCDEEIASDEKVKQVYFPVGGGQYHLLSLLTPSLIVSELRGRIIERRRMRTASRDKNDERHGQDWSEIYDLTEIGFGGTKPQNISVLNMHNGGKAYLLSSRTPTLGKSETTKPPKRDFFTNTVRRNRFKQDFQYLHTLFASERNNLAARDKIKRGVQAIIDQVMVNVFQLREIEAGWSAASGYEQLPLAQKIWLDNVHAALRHEQGEWMDEISRSFARWIIRTYEKLLKDDSIMLGDGELLFLQKQVMETLAEDKESLG